MPANLTLILFFFLDQCHAECPVGTLEFAVAGDSLACVPPGFVCVPGVNCSACPTALVRMSWRNHN